MLYIDTSSLLKLLWQEAESEQTRQRIGVEQKVVQLAGGVRGVCTASRGLPRWKIFAGKAERLSARFERLS